MTAVQSETFESLNPASGEPRSGASRSASPQDVRAAVERARRAALWWAGLGSTAGPGLLHGWRARLANRIDELAELIRREAGKPVAEATVESPPRSTTSPGRPATRSGCWARGGYRLAAGPRAPAYLSYQPFGVVGVIGPWNYPLFTPVGSIAYALAAGNAVVFKPSEYTPAVGQWLVDSFAEVVPEHPVCRWSRAGRTGAALCRSGVDKLAFTGSTATGKKIMAACAETLTPVLLECGGKDAMIVDADADLDAAAGAAVWGGLTNAGQTCIGIERVYVVDTVYDAFVRGLSAGPRAARRRGGTDIGPITMPSRST